MKHPQEIDIYEAIRQMRILSAEGKSFSFAHYTHDMDRAKSDGLRVVNRAILRPAASTQEVKWANFKLFYTDMDTNLPRVCWQPLLAYFNGQRIKMKTNGNLL